MNYSAGSADPSPPSASSDESGSVAHDDLRKPPSGEGRTIPQISAPPGANQLPTRLTLGGEEAFEAYRNEFKRLYLGQKFVDVRGRTVIFPKHSCHHVCFCRDSSRNGDKTRSTWSQERAEHLGWILHALTDPNEIWADHQNLRNDAYLLGFPSNQVQRPTTRYYVCVEPKGLEKVVFLSGYPIQQRYWDATRQPRKGSRGLIYKRPIQRW